MSIFENNSSENERIYQKSLLKIAALFTSISILLIFILTVWIIQPLFWTVKPNQTETKANVENLTSHVKVLSENLSPQKVGFFDSLNQKADYIKSEFEKSGAQVSEQKFTVDGKVYRNVVAYFGANDKEKIIVGAHYDTAKDFSGADDNSSGIAGLIELSRLLSQMKLPLQIELVAYALEEPPFFATEQMGSFIHADSLKKQNANVRLMICLEMIGYFTDENDSQNYPVSLLKLFYPSKGNFIAVVGNFGNGLTTRRLKAAMINGVDLPIYSINAPGFVNGVDFSDHRNYWKLGYNAVMITDTAFYRNKNYHSNNDTSEKLDYPRMAKTIEATFAAIIEISK